MVLEHLVGPGPGIHLGQEAVGYRLAVQGHAHVGGGQGEAQAVAFHLEGVVTEHPVEHLVHFLGGLA